MNQTASTPPDGGGTQASPTSKNAEYLSLQYETLHSLVLDENRLVSERNQIFLATNVFLLTAYSILDRSDPTRLVFIVAGVLISGFWMHVHFQTQYAIQFWRTQLHRLEEQYLGGISWGIYLARAKHLAGHAVPKPLFPDIDGEIRVDSKRPWRVRLGHLIPINKALTAGIPLYFILLWCGIGAIGLSQGHASSSTPWHVS